jgi:uncharacterized protein (TIGR03503 family)
VGDKADVRVLIDVSGSMKHNDPKNLRRPALRLLVGLLPSDSRAGVWTFAQYVNMQIPLASVDAAWKAQARESSHKIASPGQFTNIEAVLLRATEDWQGTPRQFRRRLVLLTDGMVDISSDKRKNQASRERILHQVIPRLQSLGIVVHTVALSKNADHQLMRQLAESTDGWYEQVEDADQLQRVFLRIFEKVSNPDSVPLQDNKFVLDASVSEATVLVFRKPGARQTRLISPQGDSYDAQNAPSSIVWHTDEGYDMLTIQAPQAGEWRVDAELDPDNRVMVVTDLRMQTTELANRILQGQSHVLAVHFTDHERPIQKPAFFRGLTVTATHQGGAEATASKPLRDDGKQADKLAGDGLYSLALGAEMLPAGMSELILHAKGQTFVREKRLTYTAIPPVILEAKPAEQIDQLLITLRADERLVDASSMHTSIWLESLQGARTALDLAAGQDAAQSALIDLNGFSGSRRLVVQASGKTLAGESLRYLDSPLEIEGHLPASEVREETAAAASNQMAGEKPLTPGMEAGSGAQDDPPTTRGTDWLTAMIWLGLLNLSLILVGGALFWWLGKSRQRQLVNWLDTQALEAFDMKEKAA